MTLIADMGLPRMTRPVTIATPRHQTPRSVVRRWPTAVRHSADLLPVLGTVMMRLINRFWML